MKYIDYLLKINSHFCKESKIRTKDKTHLEIIEDAYNDAIVSDDYETVLNKAVYVAAIIKLYQPFYDGNNRTALVACKDILVKKGFNFDYEKAMNDMQSNKLVIPTLYEIDDKIGNIYDWISYMINIEYPSKKVNELNKDEYIKKLVKIYDKGTI